MIGMTVLVNDIFQVYLDIQTIYRDHVCRLPSPANVWSLHGENWGVLASVLGAGVILIVTAACCRHIRQQRQQTQDELLDLQEGPYVHKYGNLIK